MSASTASVMVSQSCTPSHCRGNRNGTVLTSQTPPIWQWLLKVELPLIVCADGDKKIHFVLDDADDMVWIGGLEVVVGAQAVVEVSLLAAGGDVSLGIFDGSEGLGVVYGYGGFDLVDGSLDSGWVMLVSCCIQQGETYVTVDLLFVERHDVL